MMEEQIQRFPAQFDWEPILLRGEALPAAGTPVVVCGMGGSHLGARLLSLHEACPLITVHSDYGAPHLPDAWAGSALYVASSYSGETEETLDAARAVLGKGLPLAVITSGGALAAFAEEHALPFIQLPKEDVEPRMTMGYQMIAFTRLFQNKALEDAVRMGGRTASLPDSKERGIALAAQIFETVPFFYASARNLPIAYHLKASVNETAKIPAAYNVVPELCHNEISGYTSGSMKVLPVFLEDDADDARVATRMTLMREMLGEKNIPTASFPITGTSSLHKALQMVLVGNYAGAVIAQKLGVPDAKTPLIAEFKERLAKRV